jgi:glyoxylase-like metal-dependent hydrolase (beta-lactamase superfamily II)
LHSDTFRFRVGEFLCTAVRDAAPLYPLDTLLTNVPKERRKSLLRSRGEDPEQIPLPYTCLLIDTARAFVLVDTGMGAPAGDADKGKLLDILRAEGIDSRQIETVVISHAHPDHVGGIATEGDTLAFPNARYVMFRQEWDFWMVNPDLAGLPLDDTIKQSMLSSARTNLSRIEAQIDLLRERTEILPGITAVPAFGHTPGHMALEISSADAELLFVADALLHPLNFEFPEARAVFDHQPETMVATRLRLLQQAAGRQCLISTTHLPFPGVGHVVPQGNTWSWRPVTNVGESR